MHEVFVGLGSNLNRHYHIREGLNALCQEFGELRISRVFESASVGFDGHAFLNMVAQFYTELPVGELSRRLKLIEDRYGRVRQGPKFAPRTLDIDILTYDDQVGEVDGVILPRPEITENAFVLWPLAELAGEHLHPLCGESYACLWADYDKARQQLEPIPFQWP